MRDYIESLIHSAKFWGLLYVLYLIGTNVILPYWAYVLCVIFVFGVAAALEHFRVQPPPLDLIHEVLGNPIEVQKRSSASDFSFIPLTSRLAVAHSLNSTVGTYPMWIIGHRGAGLDAPENSISAIRACRARGCNAVEFDIALTKDNVPVLFHDDDLERVAGINRKVRDMTMDELSQIDISTKHPLANKFTGERVPTLDEAIRTCLDLDLRFIIDLKDPDLQMADIVVNAFQKYGDPMYKRAIVSSFYPSVIYQIRRKDPKIIGSMAWRPAYHRYGTWNGSWENLIPNHTNIFNDWLACLKDMLLEYAIQNFLPWFLGLSVLLLHKDSITRESIARWINQGLRIFAWTVNNPLEKLHLTQNFNIGHLTDTLDGGDLIHTLNQSNLIKKTSQTNGVTPVSSEMFATPAASEASLIEQNIPRENGGIPTFVAN